MRRASILAAAGALALGLAAWQAFAAGETPPLKERDWPHIGIRGTYDRASIQRGFQVYKEVCAGCHALAFIAFRNLTEIGFSEDQAKAVAAEYEVPAEPTADGETLDEDGNRLVRPAALFDYLPAPFPNENAARAANNGAMPPDLSLIVKARVGHEDYIYSLQVGYTDPPAGFELADGMSYNTYFPGHQIAMPPVLSEDAVEYADGTPATVEQMAYDVTNFLAWTAEPRLEDRHSIGIGVIIFLAILSVLLYFAMRRVWAKLD